MRKTLIVCLAVIIGVALMLSLTACYISNPGKMSQLAGTYELSVYKIGTPKTEAELSQKQSEDESNYNYTDKILQKEIICYLVVKDDGTGYYVYGDKDTPLTAKNVKIYYQYDSDEADKVKEIRYTVGIAHSGDDYPGCGEEPLGVNIKSKTLNYYLGTYTLGKLSRKYTQSVTYKKVDKATDLSYVEKKLNKKFSVAAFETNGLTGLFNMDIAYMEGPEYIYYGIDLDLGKGTADVYYALKSDETPREIKGLTASYVVGEPQEYGQVAMTITVGEDVYEATYFVPVNDAYNYSNNMVATGFAKNVYEDGGNGEKTITASYYFSRVYNTVEEWKTQKMDEYMSYAHPENNE